MHADVAQLKELIDAQASQIETQAAQIAQLTQALTEANATIAKLQHQNEKLIRRIYGVRSEKYDPDQLLLDGILLDTDGSAVGAADEPEPETGDDLPKGKRKRRTPHGRLPIPDHLERVIIELNPPEEERICPETGLPMVLIGYEESEKLEYRPGKLLVNLYRRGKWVSPKRIEGNGAGVLTAPMPDYPIAKCKADVGLIAHAIVSKFADHLPFYRQDDIFEREGVRIPRSTLDGWALATADAIMPLGDELNKAVREGDILYSDDSTVDLLQPGKGKVHTARMWVYVKGGKDPPLVAFEFTLDRSGRHPNAFLADSSGYLHADAYSGYDRLFAENGDLLEVGCWAHARRKFDEAKTSRPGEACEVLGMIQLLYAVEKQCEGLPAEVVAQVRGERSLPQIDAIFARLEVLQKSCLPSEPLATAITYALNQREALCRYVEDGRLKPDNNIAENAIRPLALGRKNWMFAGSERGGKAAALYLGLIQSCRMNGVNPWAYFDDVLRRIMSHPANQLRDLLPDRWKPAPRDAAGQPIT